MAQVRALVREDVLEKLFAGEELEIRVVDPALAHTFIGQPVNVLEQQQPDHETGLDPGPAVLAVERRNLAVDPVPIDLAGKQNQLVLQVDDLVQPRPEQIVRSRRLVLLRPHRPLRCTTESWSERKGNPKTKLQGFGFSSSQSLQSQMPPNPKNRLSLNRLEACSRTTSYCPVQFWRASDIGTPGFAANSVLTGIASMEMLQGKRFERTEPNDRQCRGRTTSPHPKGDVSDF